MAAHVATIYDENNRLDYVLFYTLCSCMSLLLAVYKTSISYSLHIHLTTMSIKIHP